MPPWEGRKTSGIRKGLGIEALPLWSSTRLILPYSNDKEDVSSRIILFKNLENHEKTPMLYEKLMRRVGVVYVGVPVCAASTCSFFYAKRFCLPCGSDNIHAFPPEIQQDFRRNSAAATMAISS
jgi:hypothetical protein